MSQCVIVINLFSNEIAEQLAKEAEALELNTQVFTKQDISKAVIQFNVSSDEIEFLDESRSFSYFLQFNK
jgi:hypothetical protein